MNLMIDLETLGTDVDAVVISIGACFFDPKTKEIGAKFNMNLNVEDQMTTRSITASTLKWWMCQADAAKTVFNEESAATSLILKMFVTWVLTNAKPEEVVVWGNGANFDISIIEHILKENKVVVPWLYKNVMDLRTFKKYIANDAKIVRHGVHHNALDDAISQAQFVMEYSK